MMNKFDTTETETASIDVPDETCAFCAGRCCGTHTRLTSDEREQLDWLRKRIRSFDTDMNPHAYHVVTILSVLDRLLA